MPESTQDRDARAPRAQGIAVPAYTKLIPRFRQALESEGWGVLQVGAASKSPYFFRVFRSPDVSDIKLYIWTLTPGGKTRPLDEWRIQPASVGQFTLTKGARTVILGYEPTRDLFVGFDFRYHTEPLGGSPSIQTKQAALDQATTTGLASHRKDNGELAIAFRPDYLATYLTNLETLHSAEGADAALLQTIAANPETMNEADIEAHASSERRRVLQTTLRLLRDRRFRVQVLGAYDHRCALCGLQLDLIEAAHILPVGHTESTDLITNGVALCALHHTAYDAALVTFDPAYKVHVSVAAEAKLSTVGRAGGLAQFKTGLAANLAVPANPAQRPDTLMVQKANGYRGWVL